MPTIVCTVSVRNKQELGCAYMNGCLTTLVAEVRSITHDRRPPLRTALKRLSRCALAGRGLSESSTVWQSPLGQDRNSERTDDLPAIPHWSSAQRRKGLGQVRRIAGLSWVAAGAAAPPTASQPHITCTQRLFRRMHKHCRQSTYTFLALTDQLESK